MSLLGLSSAGHFGDDGSSETIYIDAPIGATINEEIIYVTINEETIDVEVNDGN